MATSKKPATKRPARTRKSAPGKKAPSVNISIDLKALDKLYKKRYVISLDGGDTKGGSVKVRDGDTKGGSLKIRDGDTKGGGARRRKPGPRPRTKKAPRKR